VADLGFVEGVFDFGNPARTEEVWGYWRILCICELAEDVGIINYVLIALMNGLFHNESIYIFLMFAVAGIDFDISLLYVYIYSLLIGNILMVSC